LVLLELALAQRRSTRPAPASGGATSWLLLLLMLLLLLPLLLLLLVVLVLVLLVLLLLLVLLVLRRRAWLGRSVSRPSLSGPTGVGVHANALMSWHHAPGCATSRR
jgi:hypothetical protein